MSFQQSHMVIDIAKMSTFLHFLPINLSHITLEESSLKRSILKHYVTFSLSISLACPFRKSETCLITIPMHIQLSQFFDTGHERVSLVSDHSTNHPTTLLLFPLSQHLIFPTLEFVCRKALTFCSPVCYFNFLGRQHRIGGYSSSFPFLLSLVHRRPTWDFVTACQEYEKLLQDEANPLLCPYVHIFIQRFHVNKNFHQNHLQLSAPVLAAAASIFKRID